MKKKKIAGLLHVATELTKSFEEEGVQRNTELLRSVWNEERMPEDILQCGNHRGIKLIEHLSKVQEKVVERRLR